MGKLLSTARLDGKSLTVEKKTERQAVQALGLEYREKIKQTASGRTKVLYILEFPSASQAEEGLRSIRRWIHNEAERIHHEHKKKVRRFQARSRARLSKRQMENGD